MCLLDLLEREKKAKRELEFVGDMVVYYRQKQMETDCNTYMDKLDKALMELNSVRDDIKAYFKEME